MWDPFTNVVVTTCDVIWMKWMYFTYSKDALFDVESIPLDTDAKDVEDVIGTKNSTINLSQMGRSHCNNHRY